MSSNQPEKPKVLITRPEPEATTLAGLFEERGHQTIVAPLFEIEGAAPSALPSANALLLTSPRAARFLPDGVSGLPTYAIGEATAKAARLAGLSVASVAEGNASSLKAEIFAEGTELLHLSGQEIARDLAPDFEEFGIPYSRVVTYRAVGVQALPPAAKNFLQETGDRIAVLMSVRAADVLAHLVAEADLKDLAKGVSAACFGPRIAKAARASLPYRTVRESEPGNVIRFVDFVSSGGT